MASTFFLTQRGTYRNHGVLNEDEFLSYYSIVVLDPNSKIKYMSVCDWSEDIYISGMYEYIGQLIDHDYS